MATMNKQELIKEIEIRRTIRTIYGEGSFPGTYIEGRRSTWREAKQLVEQLDEPQKHVMPKFFDKWAKQVLEKRDKFYAISLITRAGWGYGVDYELDDDRTPSGTKELLNWIVENEGDDYPNKKKAVEALLYGYEVEKEPVYAVTIPDESPVTKLSFQTEDGTQFNYDKNDPDYLALLFNDKEQADAVALLLKGKVVEK